MLRIAFFGTDNLGRASLAKLHDLKRRNPSLIETLDLITRSVKPTGRGLQTHIETPAAVFANQNSIPTLRADNTAKVQELFKNGHNYNIAVAASYGPLIPASFLGLLKYGGLNVHPSLLPHLRGAAPVPRAILNGDKYTGVSVQTLHPTEFDRGKILAQSEQFPLTENDYCDDVLDRLGERGAELLSDVIENQLFVDMKPLSPPWEPSDAPKINKAMRNVNWLLWSTADVMRHYRVFYSLVAWKDERSKKQLQTLFHFADIYVPESPTIESEEPGSFWLNKDDNALYIKTKDGVIAAKKFKPEYKTWVDAKSVYQRLTNKLAREHHKFVPKAE